MEKRDSVPGKIGVFPMGILDPRGSASRIRVNRYEPSPPLALFIDHLWIGEWNLEGRPPEIQRVLLSPNAHLVIGPGYTSLFGVVVASTAASFTAAAGCWRGDRVIKGAGLADLL